MSRAKRWIEKCELYMKHEHFKWKSEERQRAQEGIWANEGNHRHLPVTAAVFCRTCWQDDGAGHQHLQQDHQDKVKVDLKMDGSRESKDILGNGHRFNKKMNKKKWFGAKDLFIMELHSQLRGSGLVYIQTKPGRWLSQQTWTRRPLGSLTPW